MSDQGYTIYKTYCIATGEMPICCNCGKAVHTTRNDVCLECRKADDAPKVINNGITIRSTGQMQGKLHVGEVIR